MYKALYRKWRPKTFDDVIGQKQVTDVLKNEVSSGRISHAYLFTGSRGTGKTSCAKILAKAINCQSPENGNPCGKCEICLSIESEKTLDIAEIDAASNNSVENIRDMREEIVFTPAICKYRVYIVDEVHMLSQGAFNAFLKILEEPPSYVVFILATTELHKIPATIMSRCQKFMFHKLSTEDISSRIKYVCEQENIQIDDSSVSIISDSADGGMRDALSILDQCYGVCGNSLNEKSVREILGISDDEHIDNLIEAILSGNFINALKYIDEIYKQCGNIAKLCSQIIESFRNIMIYKATKSECCLPKNPELKKIIDDTNLNIILDCLKLIQESYNNIHSGIDKKLELEISVLKLSSKFNKSCISVPYDAITHNIIDAELPKKDITVNNCNSSQIENGKLSSEWQEILDKMKESPNLKSLYISLKNSEAYKNGKYILIKPNNSMAFELLKKSEQRSYLKQVIAQVLGESYNIGPYESVSEKENVNISPLDKLIKKAELNNIKVYVK